MEGKGKGKVHPRTGHECPEGEQRYSSTLSLTSALDEVDGQRHAPAALYPRERTSTNCVGGWVGPRAGLDGCGKSRPHRDSIPGSSNPQPVAIPTELSRPTKFPILLIDFYQFGVPQMILVKVPNIKFHEKCKQRVSPVAYRGVFKTPLPKFQRPSKIVPNSTRL